MKPTFMHMSWLLLALLLLPGVVAAQETYPMTEIYQRLSPSVVAISVTAEAPTGPEGENAPPLFGSGSGFVFDTDGHIVTNFHVVDGASRIEVRFFDGTLTTAEVVGLDDDSDLAVLRVDLPEDRLIPVEFADTDQLVVGQPVVALGSPFGQNWTLTSGIISALDRTIPGLDSFSIGGVIQTDAAINPGNSGGPLLDMDGRVIGVNAQIRSTTNANSGIGFAIPGNLTQRVVLDLIEDGYVEYSYIGISGGDVTLPIIQALDLPSDFQGVAVSDVMAGGPAARAGLQEAELTQVNGQAVPRSIDIITAIDGEPLSGISDLISYLARNTEPGQTVTLSVLRDGEAEMEFDVRLTPRP